MKVVKLTREGLAAELKQIEACFNVPASAFYDRFRDGEMGDSFEVMKAAGLCYTALRAGLPLAPRGAHPPNTVVPAP